MPLWSTLNNDEKNKALRQLIEKAGWHAGVHNECTSTDPLTVLTAVQREANVTFDNGVELKCFKDKAAAEKQVLILLPPLVPQTQPPPVPPFAAGYWMCTYPTYVPK